MLNNLSKQMSKKDYETFFIIKEDEINNTGKFLSEKAIYQGLVLTEWKQSFTNFSTADKRIIFRELAGDIHEALFNLYCLPTLPGEMKVVA